MVAWWWLLVAFAAGAVSAWALMKWVFSSFIPNNWR